ncbi:hypothetical protein [Nitrosomonas sp.]|uniref:hypothetical protein n=1 Tax=Nitrosomonas sp. TaxID=42353 RepID=UPI0025FB6168|nr:hypothetical protein [Nitrosomonas sp.]HNA14784.1 hypothetical protein [Cyclobacteriaceae bacterium]HNE47324.1 hypothetical protein [Chitinophagales bacterium]MBV6446926.1 hypothetical protein [Nitrosomonas sp.]HMV12903.1 hypothetical protein [Nitrosomonas sp.]HMW20079.1 hypothetical protein [Nitrosomonas sp.]
MNRIAIPTPDQTPAASLPLLDAVKATGYNQAEIVEIVLHVALNTLTNYINEIAQTEIDFPVISPATRATA